ncbi:5'/3'-nucleotidase SurE [Kiloniella sp. b19]|uniref:5'/3'-nucleotidase SurE n=1 Tax=Kiloniella sp. GXU_MW_B19 TaxID=3141326 RepID=UPI0031E4265D
MTPCFPELRILISNDDGIHSGGIALLEELARQITDDVWVVAPDVEQSAASHALTLRKPLRFKSHGNQRYSVDGTPTDSVLMGVKHLLRDRKPDLILSGINHGMNLGEDVIYSGTVAAAMEGAILGIPSIAFSLRMRESDEAYFWDTPRAYLVDVVRKLWQGVLSPDCATKPESLLYNVNFPSVPASEVAGIKACCQGHRVSGTALVDAEDPHGRPLHWIGQYISHDCAIDGSDLNAIADRFVTVSPLQFDLTQYRALEQLEGLF